MGRFLFILNPVSSVSFVIFQKDAAGIVSSAFKKESIKPWLLITGSTALLLLSDQAIADGVIQFSENIHLHPEEKNKTSLILKGAAKM
ncbi:MAG: hypothetical protein WKG06_38645 [Segetibacter sp.]